MIEGLNIGPIGANGLRITGIDASRPIDPATARRLYSLWMAHPIIYFPEVGTDPQAHIQLSAVFGRTAPHAIAAIRHPEHEKLIRLTYENVDGAAHSASFMIDGEPAPGWLPWHKDGFFGHAPNHGSMLNPIRIAYAGGETAFLDTTQAYDELPDAMKRRIADLEIVFDPMSLQPPLRYGAMRKVESAPTKRENVVRDHTESVRQDRIAQKMVDVHPISGAPILNLTSLFGPVILGMDKAASDELLIELLTFAEQPRFVYKHPWRPGDLVLWDNWRCLHSVNPHPPDATREMHRSTIVTDVTMGRTIPAEAA